MMMVRNDDEKYRGGFTLVELLVVIGIIAVLISVLLPVLSGARDRAYNVQCMSNLRQIGMAAQMYAQQNKGQFPLGAGTQGGATLEKFTDWSLDGPTNPPDRYSIREAVARCLGIKNPQVVGLNTVAVPVMFCPVMVMTHVRQGSGSAFDPSGRPIDDPTNFLSNGNGSGQLGGKFCYSWVANPFTFNSVYTNSGGNADLAAAWFYWHMDVTPTSQTDSTPHDTARPCKPGLDYMRKITDKNAATTAICVDSSRQATTGWFWMHGNGSKNPQRGWKNELMGDGHVEQVRPDQCRARWGPSFGTGNGPTGW